MLNVDASLMSASHARAADCLLIVWYQVNIRVECTIAKDTLKGDDATELHLKLLSHGAESYPFKDDD